MSSSAGEMAALAAPGRQSGEWTSGAVEGTSAPQNPDRAQAALRLYHPGRSTDPSIGRYDRAGRHGRLSGVRDPSGSDRTRTRPEGAERAETQDRKSVV